MPGTQAAECAECGRRLRLRKNGTIWNHTDHRKPAGTPFGPRCDGAGKPSRPGTVQRVDEET